MGCKSFCSFGDYLVALPGFIGLIGGLCFLRLSPHLLFNTRLCFVCSACPSIALNTYFSSLSLLYALQGLLFALSLSWISLLPSPLNLLLRVVNRFLLSLEPKILAQILSFSTSMKYPESIKSPSSSPSNAFNLFLLVLFLQNPLSFHALLLHYLRPRPIISHRVSCRLSSPNCSPFYSLSTESSVSFTTLLFSLLSRLRPVLTRTGSWVARPEFGSMPRWTPKGISDSGPTPIPRLQKGFALVWFRFLMERRRRKCCG